MRIYECEKIGNTIYVVVGNKNFKKLITLSCYSFLANLLRHHYLNDEADNELYPDEKKYLKINKYI